MPTHFFTNKLEGKRVVIIGGTSGLGFAVAQGCLEFGASVVVASSNQARVDDAIVRLSESGDASRISGYALDLSGGIDGIKGMESRITKFLLQQVKDPFDHLVFTAGDTSPVATIAGTDLEQANRDMSVRYWAPFAACKILQNNKLLRETGSITFTSGVLVVHPKAGFAGVAGMGSLFTLCKLAALEMAPIRCNVVVPGPVQTELWGNLLSDEVLKDLGDKTTIQRVPGPHDTAEAYLYCMRDGSVTGQTIITDSGTLLL